MAYHADLDTTLARYTEAWNTADADERWALVHACATADVVYNDPHSEKPVEGQAALAAFMGFFREQVGWRFAFTGAPDGHHEWLRVPWALANGDGTKATGLLVATLDRDVRFVTITHFVDAA
ncbi:nuclear transport factor 2 family protein [Rubrivirga sp. IMCC43871]|uniref:nuclear transport factor 2 family protein n=1 Tax=Rubrivirga sp. IMCC43871 TaxID=3391575 RepID=UPI00398FB1F4